LGSGALSLGHCCIWHWKTESIPEAEVYMTRRNLKINYVFESMGFYELTPEIKMCHQI
jgi:hypothetical protein